MSGGGTDPADEAHITGERVVRAVSLEEYPQVQADCLADLGLPYEMVDDSFSFGPYPEEQDEAFVAGVAWMDPEALGAQLAGAVADGRLEHPMAWHDTCPDVPPLDTLYGD